MEHVTLVMVCANQLRHESIVIEIHPILLRSGHCGGLVWYAALIFFLSTQESRVPARMQAAVDTIHP